MKQAKKVKRKSTKKQVSVSKKISFLKKENTTSNLFTKVFKRESVKKLSKKLKVSETTVRRWHKQGYVPDEKKYNTKVKKLAKENKIKIYSYKTKIFTQDTFNISSFKKKKQTKEFLKHDDNTLYEFRAGIEIEFSDTMKGSKKWVIQNLHFARFYTTYKQGLKNFEGDMKEYISTAFQSKVKKFRLNYFNVLKVKFNKDFKKL